MPRLETIRQLLYRLAKQKVAGVVDIKTFAGRFCLVGNTVDGYSLAPDETPFAKLRLVGNPSEEALSPAQRIPLALANLIGDIRSFHPRRARRAGARWVTRRSVLSPYPPVAASSRRRMEPRRQRQQPRRDPRALNGNTPEPHR